MKGINDLAKAGEYIVVAKNLPHYLIGKAIVDESNKPRCAKCNNLVEIHYGWYKCKKCGWKETW